jgi:hypothetical protein
MNVGWGGEGVVGERDGDLSWTGRMYVFCRRACSRGAAVVTSVECDLGGALEDVERRKDGKKTPIKSDAQGTEKCVP